MSPISGAPPLFLLILLAFVSVFLFVIGKNLLIAIQNLGQPVIDRPARIVGRRQATWVSGGHHTSASAHTNYFATFEFKDGSRQEFRVPTREYALLAEGDAGTLYTQGTWFKGFSRVHDGHVV